MRRGTAGEYIVCADLLLSGFPAVLAGAGEFYDVIAEIEGKFKRIQVKSSSFKNNRYSFTLSGGRGSDHTNTNRPPLDLTQFDLLACVALDSKSVLYYPHAGIQNTDGTVKKSLTLRKEQFA